MKLNNKGFAISSLMYGLLLVAFLIVSLLMSIMHSNRHNTSTLVERIEEELNRYSRTTTTLEYISSASTYPVAQEYIVPYGKAGWYRIELWGAGATTDVPDENTGRGSYVSSMVYLPENQHIYFYIGKNGNGSAGGSTNVRTVAGGDTSTSENSIFMLAGGGGKKDNYTGEGYSSLTNGTGISSKSTSYENQYWEGDSFISGYPGVNAVNADGTAASNNTNSPSKFIITAADDFTNSTSIFSASEKAAMETNGNTTFAMQTIIPAVNPGNGRAKIELVSTNKADVFPTMKNMKDSTTGVIQQGTIHGVRFCLNNGLYNNAANTNGGKELFSDIQISTKHGTNNLKSKTGSNFSYPSGTTATATKQAYTDGQLTAITRTNNYTAATNCITYSISGWLNIPLLEAVAFPTAEKTGNANSLIKDTDGENTYSTFTAEVNYDGSWTKVKTIRSLTPDERTNGIKISNYELSYNTTIPTANYFITTRSNYTRAITAQERTDEDDPTLTVIEFYNAEKTQQWLIQQVGTDASGKKYYKIVENKNNTALQPHDQGKELGEYVSTFDGPYTGKEWQHWYINRQENGYYQFQSVSAKTGLGLGLPNFTTSQDLCLERDSSNSILKLDKCATNGNNTTGNGTQWFKINPIDY